MELEAILLRENLLSEEQIKNVKKVAEEKGSTLIEILVEEDLIREKTLLLKIAQYLHIELLDFDNVTVKEEALYNVPKEMASSNCMFPFDFKNNLLSIAVSNPFNMDFVQKIEFLTKVKTRIYLASKRQILESIEQYYKKQIVKLALNDLERKFEREHHFEREQGGKEETLQEAPTVKIIDAILYDALLKKASDIHIEPFEKVVCVRFRIDGMLMEYMQIPKEIYGTLCARIKVMAKMDIAEKRTPQDGKTSFSLDNKTYDFRVSSLPTVYGEKIVIRILDKSEEICSLEELGFNINKDKIFKAIVELPYGMVLITGPTGSGKSTTLYSVLNSLDHTNKNIITIEDPVEHTIFGINQVNINHKVGITYATGLKSVLRQDPDIIMIGEIRDEDTAKMAIRAAITGHVVFSTLHTNDALSSIYRLRDMGIPQYLLVDGLVVVIAQRLVRKICPHCKVEIKATEKIAKILNVESETRLYKGTGCKKCNYTGYKDRTVVYEIIHLDQEHKNIIEKQGTLEELKIHSKKVGNKFLRDHCIELIKGGITTYEECCSIIYAS